MRVLVVEDELKLGSALEEGLSEAQYTVDLALDGEEGLDFARVTSYDAIILDVMLPRVDFAELLARLRALLRRDSSKKEGILRVSDLSLDPAAQRVRWGDRTVELTTREYRILETLVRRPGWVVGREAIVESVWGFDYPDSSNLIEVYIGRLRRKLSENGAPHLIQTVRGSGYRLQEPAP